MPQWFSIVLLDILKMALILAVVPPCMMYTTQLERKAIARIQDRFGPNRVGPYGLAQPFADMIKMLVKEDIVPKGSDKLCHLLAPLLIVVPSLFLFTLLPFGPGFIAAPISTGLLFFMALGSTGTLAIFTAGWTSRSAFPLLGAIRNAAQLIAYEVPFVLASAVIPMIVGSLRMTDIVMAQSVSGWFIFTPWGFTAFLLLFTAGLAEVNRTPFDLPEAESELVGGFHTEYSGMKFGLFYLAEYVSTIALAVLLSVLFFGGWAGPRIPFLPALGSAILWISMKSFLLVFVTIWIRGTWPRFRVDRLMGFAWKVMIPVALANLVGAAVWFYCPGFIGTAVSAVLVVSVFLLTSQLWAAPKPVLTTTWADQTS
ncbi:MAG: NADH-quinone oxidoreductase subunit NuoH [Candidatus Omnitrophica bacterium]|nr:NADH-quinone oxidoreductase subunit NuoH [Candidatus Omnitrophota bacterium]